MSNVKSQRITIVIPGDLHLTEKGIPNHQTAEWVVDQANSIVHPDFVQFIGDNVQDATPQQFEIFLELTGQLQSPWYALVGDHDVHHDAEANGYRSHIGKTWGSLNFRGYRFLRLNTQESKPVGLSSQQIEWLGHELAAAKLSGERVVLFQHNYPYQIWEEFAGTGIDEWRALIQKHRIEAIFCGHTHYWQLANDGRNVHLAMRSIGDPEGGQGGYAIACFAGADFGCSYRTPEDDGPIVLILHPRRKIFCTGSHQIVRGPFTISVRIWSIASVVVVTAQLNDRCPIALELSEDGLWQGKIDSSEFSKGSHWLRVMAEDDQGRVGEQVIDFVVDSTGRYTAVPSAEPAVDSTQFC